MLHSQSYGASMMPQVFQGRSSKERNPDIVERQTLVLFTSQVDHGDCASS